MPISDLDQQYAALYGQYEMCELLISEGADVLAEACYPFHP
jgi:hypothetical protein